MATDKIEHRVLAAKGNPSQLNQLIDDYQPFVAKVVTEHIGKAVYYGHDEELSVALLAFSEAVQSYDSSKGAFLSLARRVIRLRLIDYYRSQKKHQQLNARSLDEPIHDSSFDIHQYHLEQSRIDLRAEILSLKDELEPFGIDFFELTQNAPKSSRLQSTYIKIARWIATDLNRHKHFLSSGKLPAKEIMLRFLVSKKTLERGRVYIIACMVIIHGDYQLIQQYLEWT